MIERLNYLNEELVCDFCGEHFLRKQRDASNKSGRHFCSIECGMKFSNSFATSESARKALSFKMKQLFQEGKIQPRNKGKKYGPNKKKLAIYLRNPHKCKTCGAVVPYERRESNYCCSEHAPKGGIRRGSSHGKKGWYKGYWCDSSWELAYVIYNMERNIDFKRNYEYFDYQFKGKTYKYYPDFIMNDGTLVEVKGYNSKKWQAKLKAFPKNRKLQVLYRSDMKPILEYVTQRYGKNFISLYE